MSVKLKSKRPKNSRNLTTTLAIAFVALSLIALLVASSLELYFNIRSQQELVASQLQLIALDAAHTVQDFIQDGFRDLEAAVKFGDPTTTSPTAQKLTLEKLLGLQPAFRQLVLFDNQEQVIVGASRLVGATESDLGSRIESDLFSQTKQGERYIGPVYIDEVTFEPLLLMAVPAKDVFGDFYGTLVAEINLKFMWDLVDSLQIGQTGQAYVVDRQGRLLAFGDISRVLSGENLSDLREVRAFEEAAGTSQDQSRANLSTGINGTTVLGAYAPLGTPNWAVVTELPLAEAYQGVIRNIGFSGGVILVVAMLAAVAGAYLARLLAKPLLNLTETVTRITKGDIGLQAAIEGSTEVAALATAFNSMTAQLRDFIGSLEDQVQERTTELTLSMVVGQRASTIREMDELLPTITEFIREQFGLYYTQVYFVDDVGQNLLIKAGTGTVGQELLARRHSLPIGLGSIVGRVAAEGKSIVVADTENSDIHKANPLLPETRCELAVPLLVEGRVIGVLDMQANRVNTFSEQNMTVFEAMATQLAVSIDSIRQLALTQEAQQKAEEANRRLTQENWANTLASRREALGFAYDLSSIAPLKDKLQKGGVSVPVLVQNEPIGQLAVAIPSERTLSTDEQDLLVAVAQQLAQKAENLRLFEQTQQRAAREQIAREITDKVRASRDIETALKAAAEELSKALGTARAVVDLKVASPSPGQQDQS